LQSSSHGGQPCNLFTVFALSHKGKATSDVSYNPEDRSEAYINASIHTRLSEYTSMAREVHGPEYDPTTEDLDTEIVMRVGGGKKKGRYWIADGAIDSDLSKEHECEPSHTTSAGHFTPSDTGTPDYSFFIHHSLIITYLFFALL
jgi:hypothetical protein